MSGLARRNLKVDLERVRAVTRRRDTSESLAVDQAVNFALAAEEVMAAIHDLHERSGLDDVFGRLADEADLADAPS